MTPPIFWTQNGPIPRLLTPAAKIVAALTARRVSRPGYRAPVPVLCCGNASVGGAGKTTLVLDLARRLQARGLRVHCLTRGYGGRALKHHKHGALRVLPGVHRADWVGDEPLLLAAAAPTWICRDRAAGARAALADGAQILLMDDGLQNPTLHRTASLLVIDGAAGFGNGRVLPAGPLREPASAAAARCQAAVLIGDDATGALCTIPALPVLHAWLEPDTQLPGVRVLAFAGIGRPEKFFTTVQDAGAVLIERRAFPDHHPYRSGELQALFDRAAALFATPVTTPKDAIRLSSSEQDQVQIVGIRLRWADEPALERWLDQALS